MPTVTATPQLHTPIDSYMLPTDVYELATSWSPQPEIDRLLHLCREAGVTPLSALELGCGAGRLMRALRDRGVGACGIDLSEPMIARAKAAGLDAHLADMSDFNLQRTFDLIYVSANTIRHITDGDAWERMWQAIARNLPAGGLFIADLELGIAYLAATVGKPQVWTMSSGDSWVRSAWTLVEPPTGRRGTARCRVEWTFECGGVSESRTYRLAFPLRCDDATDFLAAAARAGLSLVGMFENRDPFLIPRAADRAEGRSLVVLRKP
ncbi:MAG: class I SAM-dependent methyltransferase [Phycisphaerae bacterium]